MIIIDIVLAHIFYVLAYDNNISISAHIFKFQ